MSKIEDLQKIKKLLDEGMITQIEFENLKLNIIGKSGSSNSNITDKTINININLKDNEKQCSNCNSIINKFMNTCPLCNYEFISKEVEIEKTTSIIPQQKVEFELKDDAFYKKEVVGSSNKNMYLILAVMILFIAGLWYYKYNIKNQTVEELVVEESIIVQDEPENNGNILQIDSVSNSDPNEEDSEMTTDMDNNIKTQDDYAISDENLNIVYRQVMAVLTESEKTTLKHEQRMWIKYRDNYCDEENEAVNAGSLYASFHNICLTEITNERIKKLNEILKSKE